MNPPPDMSQQHQHPPQENFHPQFPPYGAELTPPPQLGSNTILGLAASDFFRLLIFIVVSVFSVTVIYSTVTSDIKTMQEFNKKIEKQITGYDEALATKLEDLKHSALREVSGMLKSLESEMKQNISTRLEQVNTKIAGISSQNDIHVSSTKNEISSIRRDISKLEDDFNDLEDEVKDQERQIQTLSNLKYRIDSLETRLRELKK